MTNSFRPQAAPVDTFVPPVSVAPPTDLDVLARALKTVNPGIQAFLGNKMDEAIEAEKAEGMELAIEDSFSDFKNVVRSVGKKDGEAAATQLIGGSIFAQKAYEKQKVEILGNNVLNKFSNSYETTLINDRPLSSYTFESPEFQGWLEEQRNEFVNQLGDINPTYVNKYFLPKLAAATGQITSYQIKQHKLYNVEQIKKLTVPTVESLVLNIDDGAKITEIIKQFEIDMNNAGIFGQQRTDQQNLIVETIADFAEEAGMNGDLSDAVKILDLAKLFPSGPDGKLSLEDNPTFLDEKNKVIKVIKNNDYNDVIRKEKLEDIEKTNELEKTLKDINEINKQINNTEDEAEKKVLQKQSQILLENYKAKYPEMTPRLNTILSNIDQNMALDYGEILIKIRGGGYDSKQQALDAAFAFYAQDPKRNQPQFDTLMRAINDVETGRYTYAGQLLGKLKTQLKNELSNVKGAIWADSGDLRGFTASELNRLEIEANDLFFNWMDKFIEKEGREPSISEQRNWFNTNIRDVYLEEAKKFKPPTPSGASNVDSSQNNNDQDFDPNKNNQDLEGDLSSNPVVNTLNQVANALTGTRPAAAGTIEEAQEQGQLKSVSKQQSLRDGANELGVKPEDLAAIISYETIGTFDPQIVGTDKNTGDTYQGLIQFGPWERENYNITTEMSFQDQVKAVVQFLKDRGVKPGHGPKEIYAAVFTGHVGNIENGGLDWVDANGTTVNKALKDLLPGGGHYEKAVQFLQQKS